MTRKKHKKTPALLELPAFLFTFFLRNLPNLEYSSILDISLASVLQKKENERVKISESG